MTSVQKECVADGR